jgi:NAD(P)-dependent dehydrogenase (short-subunit alcohol dehydrogenase family)
LTSNRFAARHAVVTGAGRGIGRAIALAFAAEGARVTAISRTDRALDDLVREAEGVPGRVASQPCDVTDRAAVHAACAAAVDRFGPAHILVNNAGVFLWKPFPETRPEEWDRTIGTNLTGAYNLARELLPAMAESRSGRIVNVSSIHGLHGDANLSAHCAAKFGLIGLTESLAREFRSANVTVNAVCPGTTDNREPARNIEPRDEPLAAKLRPQDVASAVLWLCSDDASGITGSSIEIYGGTRISIQP